MTTPSLPSRIGVSKVWAKEAAVCRFALGFLLLLLPAETRNPGAGQRSEARGVF